MTPDGQDPSPEVPAALGRYFEARQAQHEQDVTDAVAAMNPRERALVREAAVMGYVRGSIAGECAGGYGKTEIPNDVDVVKHVVDCCLGMDDIYPVMARMRRLGEKRRTAVKS